MPRFEVFIPAAETTGFNVTFRVDAENWMAALKTGMQKLGEQGSAVQNILVDIQDDNSVHVTDSQSGRVFRIRELSEEEAAHAQVKRASSTPPRPIPLTQPAASVRPKLEDIDPSTARTVIDAPAPALRDKTAVMPNPSRASVQPAPAPAQRPVSKPPPSRRSHHDPESVVELEAPTRPVIGQIGRAPKKNRQEEIEDLLAEVFERVQDVYSKPTIEDALYFMLDLALEKLGAESGTAFFADAATGDLTFTAVRGPRAKELLDAKMVVPAGTGIVGFCATEGVSLALSDVQKDPRYYAVVGEKVNYVPRSVITAPMMTHGRSFGCLQLLNKKGDQPFTEVEIGLLAYIAHQAAMYLNSR